MKWIVEYIGPHAHILIDDPDYLMEDKECIGIGLPTKLAENIVKVHNEAIEQLEE